MAKKVCTPSSEFLQELSRDLEPITQRELEDFRKTRGVVFSKALQAARDRYEDLQDTIGARMEAGVPVEPGRLTRISHHEGEGAVGGDFSGGKAAELAGVAVVGLRAGSGEEPRGLRTASRRGSREARGHGSHPVPPRTCGKSPLTMLSSVGGRPATAHRPVETVPDKGTRSPAIPTLYAR